MAMNPWLTDLVDERARDLRATPWRSRRRARRRGPDRAGRTSVAHRAVHLLVRHRLHPA